MEVNEMKRWLLSDDKDAIKWRHDPAKQTDVGALMDELATTPGGMAKSAIQTSLRNEKRKMEKAQSEYEKHTSKMDEIKELRYQEVAPFGVTREAFDRQWPEILRDLIDKGSLDSESKRLTQERRSKAARTF